MIWLDKHCGERREHKREGLDAAELHLASAGRENDQTIAQGKDATCTNTVAHIQTPLNLKFTGFMFQYKQLPNMNKTAVNLQGKAKG